MAAFILDNTILSSRAYFRLTETLVFPSSASLRFSFAAAQAAVEDERKS